MRWSFATALALLVIAAGIGAAAAQPAAPQCATFPHCAPTPKRKALAVRTAMEKKADRKEICASVTRFYTAEAVVVKFLDRQQDLVRHPDQAITNVES